MHQVLQIMYHLFIDEIQQISLRCPPALMRIRYRTMEQLQEALFIEIRIDDLDECAAYVALTPLDVSSSLSRSWLTVPSVTCNSLAREKSLMGSAARRSWPASMTCRC